ncbi:heme A synthase [Propioniciclava sinopodophylli]|uniref:Heme A synthase n=1 Tax=Propioniciclava sinopodophylli TaxID=1837344 RepID=A0A4Q9KFM8_9ACTN|nr:MULTISPECIES: COX15/CtaA family protein [Propioniciclava]MBB1502031.1 COX15/CtaA family protein [Propioniciclava sp. MC1683]TBT87228.1 heme A synthase [Propioniciclava sinopodophylli]
MDLLTSSRTLRRLTIANLVANMVIIWTGALVRLTKSGLGCPTWPQCEPGSYVPTPEQGLHGAIEFGNRLLTFVLAAIALATAIAAWRAFRRGTAPLRLFELSIGVGLGIIAQAVIGGVSVLTQLDPWVVGLHMVASVALILICLRMVHLAHDIAPVVASGTLYALTRLIFLLGMVVVALGVVVTGSGPHAGDGAATRNGFDPEWTSKIHAWAVWALVALTVLALVLAWGDARLRTIWLAVLATELFQGVVGYVQYFTHLPIVLVLGHMIGTTLFVVALGHAWYSTAYADGPAATRATGPSERDQALGSGIR